MTQYSFCLYKMEEEGQVGLKTEDNVIKILKTFTKLGDNHVASVNMAYDVINDFKTRVEKYRKVDASHIEVKREGEKYFLRVNKKNTELPDDFQMSRELFQIFDYSTHVDIDFTNGNYEIAVTMDFSD